MTKLLLAAAALLAAATAHAQDKPTLNSAPPGPPPAAPARPRPDYPEPARPPAPDLPSDRDARQAGATSGSLGNKLFLYTNLGLGYGGDSGYSQFSLSLAPAIGYRINERLAVGPGISYAYNNYGFKNAPSLNTTSFGVKVFGQVQVVDQFFAHAEYELTRAELLEENASGFLTGRKVSRQITTPLAGVGYRNQINDRVAGDVLFLYNFANVRNSIYPNPVIRFCFLFNLGR